MTSRLARVFAVGGLLATLTGVSHAQAQTTRRFVAFWRYQLPSGKHDVRLKLLNPAEGGIVTLDYAILYAERPSRPRY